MQCFPVLSRMILQLDGEAISKKRDRKDNTEVYTEFCQISTTERFAKIVNG